MLYFFKEGLVWKNGLSNIYVFLTCRDVINRKVLPEVSEEDSVH